MPLFEALDGRTSEDYVERVEPSLQGGRKMAALIASALTSVKREDGVAHGSTMSTG